jgi:glutamate-ammonia-ligase adenylyltransferase
MLTGDFMTTLPLLPALSGLPQVGYPDRVPIGFARLNDAADDAPDLRPALDRLIADPQGNALLSTLFGNSPFLTECLIRDIPGFIALLRDGPDITVNETLARLNDVVVWGAPVALDAVMARLRQAKRRCALTIALAGFGAWSRSPTRSAAWRRRLSTSPCMRRSRSARSCRPTHA